MHDAALKVESQFARIGKYEVINVIGRGGMGVVYKARDPQLDRPVAIKMIIGATPGLLKRFNVEARSMASLQHQNIVTVYDFGDQDGSPYLVMEYLEGVTLESVISSGDPLSLVRKLSICADVCSGLNYAHERGIIHRDIKPANIMLLNDGGVKIVDFGIARIGETGISRTEIVGTIFYMSPEQFQNVHLDRRTDIFSAGVVLYQLLTGALPFSAGGNAALMYQIVHQDPLPLGSYLQNYPAELDAIISKVLAKNRDQRYPSARDLAFDLLVVLDKQKHLEISQWFKRAETAVQKTELTKAEDYLKQVLKIDEHHTQAHQLLSQVQVRIRQQQHLEQARQLRIQADEAFLERRYDDALGIIEQAIALDETNQDLATLRKSIQEAISRAARLKMALRRAEEAQRTGDLDEAQQAVCEALDIDPLDTSAKALQVVILKQKEEQERQQKLRSLFDSARDQIAARNLTGALKILKEAETIDSASVELYSLLKVISAAREEQFRKLEVEKLTREIQEALNREDYGAAGAVAEDGLRRYPRDEALLKLKALADAQQQRVRLKAYARDQVLAANALLEAGKGSEALSVIENALRTVPGDPQLEPLRVIVRDRVASEEAERRKRQLLGSAQEMAAAERFDEAVQLLENARQNFSPSEEIEGVLERTRAAMKRAGIVAQALDRGQQLLDQGKAGPAVQFLETKTLELPDVRLFDLLESARRQLEQFQLALQNAIDEGKRILQKHGGSEAAKYLDMQPEKYRETPDYRAFAEVVAKRVAGEALEQELARQSDPDAQVRVAEAALRENPWNEEIKKRLAAVRGRREQISAVAEKARGLEASRKYGAAAIELQRLGDLYPQYPSLESEIRRLEQLEQQRLMESSRRQLEQFKSALQSVVEEGKRILEKHGASEAAKYLGMQPEKYRETPDYQAFAEVVAKRVAGEALEQELARHNDPDAQVRVAEAALRENPWNEEIKKRLAAVRDRRKQISAVAEKARVLETSRKYGAAAIELQRLRDLYPQYPSLESEIRRLEQLEQESTQARWNEVVETARAKADAPMVEHHYEKEVGATVIMGRPPLEEPPTEVAERSPFVGTDDIQLDPLPHPSAGAEATQVLPQSHRLPKTWLVAAIAIVVVAGAALVYRITSHPRTTIVTVNPVGIPATLNPGGDGSSLTENTHVDRGGGVNGSSPVSRVGPPASDSTRAGDSRGISPAKPREPEKGAKARTEKPAIAEKETAPMTAASEKVVIASGGNDVTSGGPPAGPPKPISGSFELNRTAIERGEKAELSWNVQNATSVKLEGRPVNSSGSLTVSPSDSTTYHLVATGPGVERDFATAISVDVPAPKPTISEQDQSAIRNLLQRYAQSFERKDAKTVQELWPTIPKEKLKVIKDSYKVNTKLTFSDFQYILDPDRRVRVLCTLAVSNQIKTPPPKPNFSILVNQKAGRWVIDFVPPNDNP